MSLVTEVAATLSDIVDRLPITTVTEIRARLDQVVVLLSATADGSDSTPLIDAVVMFVRAREAATDLLHELQAAADHVDAYRTALLGSVPGAVTSARPIATVSPADPSGLLDHLPGWSPGAKTHGYWVDSAGIRHGLLSGKHEEWYHQANQHAAQLGLVPPGWSMSIASHVEVKFAMRMRQNRIRKATIVINKIPCPDRFGCHRNLAKFLPDGAELTVYGPDGFQHTYRGGRGFGDQGG